MKEERKAKNKKKILLYYLILAACLLVIAAVTVTVIFTVGAPKSPQLAGNEDNLPPPDDENNPPPDDDNKPTATETGYKLPVSGELTHEYDFGLQTGYGQYRVHTGLDFAGEIGDEVCAVLDGEVTEIVSESQINEISITLKHADGNTSTYCYVKANDGLKVGSKVKRGEVIGTLAVSGDYEKEKGTHLHLEFKDANGMEFDPATELYSQK